MSALAVVTAPAISPLQGVRVFTAIWTKGRRHTVVEWIVLESLREGFAVDEKRVLDERDKDFLKREQRQFRMSLVAATKAIERLP
jgi:uncharacterized ferredoxin-like protein